MNPHTHLLPLLLVLLLLTPPPRATAATTTTTPHTFNSRSYQITTNVGAGLAEQIAAHMDAVFAEYTRRFANFHPRNQQPQPLHVYATRDGYTAFLAEHDIDASGSGGMFFVQPTGSALATFVQGHSLNRMYQILRHEGFHQFAFARIGGGLPIWANEGMAEYFAEGIMVDGRLRTGHVPPHRLRRLRQYLGTGRILPLQDLLTMTDRQWHARVRGGDAAALYDQAWSVVYFLVHGDPRYRQAFGHYLRMIARGEATKFAFPKAFGTDNYTAVQNAWAQYLQDLQPSPVKEAAQRLEFLAQGLKLLHQRGQTPDSIDQLKERLQAVRFRLRQTIGHGMTIEMSAQNNEMFEPPQPSPANDNANPNADPEPVTLKMTPSEDGTLPPGLIVEGLNLTVRLDWSKNPAGEPTSRIRFE